MGIASYGGCLITDLSIWERKWKEMFDHRNTPSEVLGSFNLDPHEIGYADVRLIHLCTCFLWFFLIWAHFVSRISTFYCRSKIKKFFGSLTSLEDNLQFQSFTVADFSSGGLKKPFVKIYDSAKIWTCARIESGRIWFRRSN